MRIAEICLNVPLYEDELAVHNLTLEINRTITVIDGTEQHYLFFTPDNDTKVCGVIVKIVELLAQKLGSK